MKTRADTASLAALIAGLDDDTALVALTALESAWRDKHSCADSDCWGMNAYPADWFRRAMLTAMDGCGSTHPRFFDAGAGIGAKVLYAARLGCDATGIEHNPGYVTEARKLGARVTQGDVRDADYGRYDIAFANCPFRAPARQIPFEADIARRMKAGAVLILGNRAGPAPAGWEQLTSIVDRDGAWRKPAGDTS